MKYSNEVIINAPINKVVELFDNPDNLKKWQPGFISFEHVSGEQGQPGAVSKLKYQMGRREVEMIERVSVRNLPEEFSGSYEAKHVLNNITNRFISVDEQTTRYVADNEFTFTGFMKLVAFLMPGAFKKQTQEYMDLFKEFVEKEVKK